MSKDNKQELLKIYEIMVNGINNHENKRLQMNVVYTTIIVAIITFVNKDSTSIFLSSLVILLLSTIWFFHISNCRQLSKAKFQVIFDLEKEFSYPAYTKEREYFKQTTPKINQTKLEQMIPLIFGVISFLIIAYNISIYLYKYSSCINKLSL